MKRFIVKHRKGLCICGAILFLPMLYILSISWVHFQNKRCSNLYDSLLDSAKQNGLLVSSFRRTNDPADAGKGFYEGLSIVRSEQRGMIEYHRPDGSVAFTIKADYADPLFNGRAVLKREYPSRGRPQFREAIIDNTGHLLTDFSYYNIKEFVGELDNEYSMVTTPTIYSPIFELLMDGIDVHIPPFEIFLPPVKASFIDKNGNPTSIQEVKRSIRRLKESAASN